MPTVRRVQAWYTETVEIQWSRPKDPADPTSVIETLFERHTAPPEATWKARRHLDGLIERAVKNLTPAPGRRRPDDGD